MILPRLTNAGVYTRAEKSTQKVHTFWVALGLKGVVRNDTYFPDGTLCSSFDCRSGKQKALLTLAAPGFRTVFEYGEDRENWVVMFVFPAIVFSESDNCFYWDYRGHRLPVPQSIELKPHDYVRPHIWYVVLLNCPVGNNKTAGLLDISYTLHFINQDGSEVGFDEEAIAGKVREAWRM